MSTGLQVYMLSTDRPATVIMALPFPLLPGHNVYDKPNVLRLYQHKRTFFVLQTDSCSPGTCQPLVQEWEPVSVSISTCNKPPGLLKHVLTCSSSVHFRMRRVVHKGASSLTKSLHNLQTPNRLYISCRSSWIMKEKISPKISLGRKSIWLLERTEGPKGPIGLELASMLH
jgi:hypothetical protein